MSNYHFEVKTISRGKGRSVTRAASYITGRQLEDSYSGKTCYNHREDVLFWRIFQPVTAPSDFYDLQHLCDEIEAAEHRCDARTARVFIGSLPNELPADQLVQVVTKFINDTFVCHDLCAITAIHAGRNEDEPSKNNPHAHILIPTRTVGPEGFHAKKNREWDQRKYVGIWRKRWALVQNWAYARNGLDIQVSHERLDTRDREPIPHLNQRDWRKEQHGERTTAGDRRRAVMTRNEDRIQQRQLDRERGREID